MEAGLERLAARGMRPGVIIDVGAAQGTWTAKALKYWPSATYELLEPLYEQEEALQTLQKQYPNINYHLAVAGEQAGVVKLNVSDDLDGSGIYGDNANNGRDVPVTTLNAIGAGKPGPFLIKLDTHGFEIPILEGAKETLKQTQVLIIEVYGFKISPTCLLFHELSDYLYKAGFRLADIVDIMRRPDDQAFWQADAIYVRKDNPVFNSNRYA
jgi:FkbM family methyltransferase